MKALVRELPIAEPVKDYAIRLGLATRPGAPLATDLVNRYVRYGSSPRGPQALVLAAKAMALFDGRMHAGFQDVRGAARQSLGHRVLLNFEGEAEGITAERIVDDVVERVPDSMES
jgi:MoxR-like ATPase